MRPSSLTPPPRCWSSPRPERFGVLWPFCQEAAFIRPTVLTCQTLVEPERWATSMETALTANPDFAGLKLRWGPSFRGERLTAQPAARAQQLQMHKRAAASANKGSATHMAEVATVGNQTYDPMELMAAVAGLLQTRGRPPMAVRDTADGSRTMPVGLFDHVHRSLGQDEVAPAVRGGGSASPPDLARTCHLGRSGPHHIIGP